MKKTYTTLLIVIIVCAVISVILCFLSIVYTSNRLTDFNITNKLINETTSTNSPGGGWLLALGIVPAFMLDIATMAVLAFFVVLIPGFTFFIAIILQFSARLFQIGEENKWKNTTSKVLTCIVIALIIILSIYLLLTMIAVAVNKLLILLALILNTVLTIIFIKEFKRIKKPENDTIE